MDTAGDGGISGGGGEGGGAPRGVPKFFIFLKKAWWWIGSKRGRDSGPRRADAAQIRRQEPREHSSPSASPPTPCASFHFSRRHTPDRIPPLRHPRCAAWRCSKLCRRCTPREPARVSPVRSGAGDAQSVQRCWSRPMPASLAVSTTRPFKMTPRRR